MDSLYSKLLHVYIILYTKRSIRKNNSVECKTKNKKQKNTTQYLLHPVNFFYSIWIKRALNVYGRGGDREFLTFTFDVDFKSLTTQNTVPWESNQERKEKILVYVLLGLKKKVACLGWPDLTYKMPRSYHF